MIHHSIDEPELVFLLFLLKNIYIFSNHLIQSAIGMESIGVRHRDEAPMAAALEPQDPESHDTVAQTMDQKPRVQLRPRPFRRTGRNQTLQTK
jgi:hypothetical protein